MKALLFHKYQIANCMYLISKGTFFFFFFFNETSCEHELTEHCPQVIEPGSPPRTNPNHPTVSSLVSRGPQSLVSHGCLTTPLFKCTLCLHLFYTSLMDSPLSIGHVQSCHVIPRQRNPVRHDLRLLCIAAFFCLSLRPLVSFQGNEHLLIEALSFRGFHFPVSGRAAGVLTSTSFPVISVRAFSILTTVNILRSADASASQVFLVLTAARWTCDIDLISLIDSSSVEEK